MGRGAKTFISVDNLFVKELVSSTRSPPLQNCVGCLLCYAHSHNTPVAMTVVAYTEN